MSPACLLCRSPEGEVCLDDVRDYITARRFTIRRCRACRVQFTLPQPADLSSYYPASYRRYHGPVRAALQWLYGWRMRALRQAVGRTGLALDLGCGDGWMLQSLRRHGWSVVGIERTTQSAAPAAAEHRLPMVVGSLDAIRPAPCLDVIIMFHVLEHLADPVTVLRQCAQRLKPDGLLVVSVPNIESWQARCFGRHWFHLDVPRHLFHFSPASVRQVLASAGLEVRCLRFASWEHDPYGWVQSSLNWLGFPQNQLTKALIGMNGSARWRPHTLAMAAVAALLIIPSACLSVMSWILGRGAILEVWARRPEA